MTYLSKIGLTELCKKIKSKIPTKTSELENDSNFITNVDIEVTENSANPVSGGAVKTYVDAQLENIETLLSEV